MTEGKNYSGQLVFGLDIGTRSIVGTVGYRNNNRFYAVAQRVKEHETRAMLDGQIHDIRKVGETVRQVKEELEKAIGRNLTEACIAAAGRVLRTVNVTVDTEFGYDKEITQEDMYALTSLGVEKAYEMFQEENDTDMRFYCVGHSVIHYYINRYPISNPEGHKAKILSAEMIATFLPDDVVDGLHKAVELAGLHVANMTLEPIAAIQVAIPEMYRMLNIALVDVGAGTSDISITKDGSIIAFGMLPMAGDALTETIAKHCLVDFGTAEQIKKDAGLMKEVTYKDIMGLQQSIVKDELLEVLDPVIQSMAVGVADKIKELNGGKSVSAVFVVGGGGKMEGYTDRLAEELGIQKERVAVHGGEVLQAVEFLEENIVKDSLLVTPIGICLSFYEQSNNFIFVDFNGQRIKLYDNNMLAVVDAAMQAEFAKEGLFPRRGKELDFTVNGKARIVRGQLGEAAVIRVNGEEADIHTPIHGGDKIQVIPSTAGEPAAMELGALHEFGDVIRVTVNDKVVELPKFARVNGQLQSGYYDIKNHDVIEMLNYYTVKQIADFMDVMVDYRLNMYVNNQLADMDTCVYENFTVSWAMKGTDADTWLTAQEKAAMAAIERNRMPEPVEDVPMPESYAELAVEKEEEDKEEEVEKGGSGDEAPDKRKGGKIEEESVPITVSVNGMPVTMTGKASYVFVDVFDYIDFDLSKPQGARVVTKRSGQISRYMGIVENGDVLEVYWVD